MKYLVEYISASNLEKIEQVWKLLERGSDMTLFQSYDWNKMLLEFYIPKDTKYYESQYAIVKNEETVCLIAPLWITKKTFRFFPTKKTRASFTLTTRPQPKGQKKFWTRWRTCPLPPLSWNCRT